MRRPSEGQGRRGQTLRFRAGIKRNPVCFADGQQSRSSAHGAAGQSATRENPLASHDEVSQPRQGVGEGAEFLTRRQEPPFHTSLPVAGIADYGGGGRNVGHFNGVANSHHDRLQDGGHIGGDARLLGAVACGVVFTQAGPVLIIPRRQEAGDGCLAGGRKGRIEVEEAKGDLVQLGGWVKVMRRIENTGEQCRLRRQIHGYTEGDLNEAAAAADAFACS